jgi:hypothetical protein
MDTPLLILANFRIEQADEKVHVLVTDNVDPNRIDDLTDIELPSTKLPITERLLTDPTWHKPKMDTPEPVRIILLMEQPDPTFK